MLRITNVSYSISDRFSLQNLNLQIEEGTHVSIIGESGCGKTTLLKLIYGLYDTDTGTIFWKDHQITGPKDHLVPGMPFIKYLSQDFDLMPFISVEENIQKFLSRLYPKESEQRTQELLEVVEMSAFAKAHVKTLSGGQKQRVALAQSLAKEPKILLLDEPFSMIEPLYKEVISELLLSLKAKKGIVITDHYYQDVWQITDRIAVLKNGVLHKAETKEDLQALEYIKQ